ncbi:predicted protein [Nematostella vectensis]|uniref:PA14 domain-containing protein n=1 Tax=Nematostella vectensis TaxID=45351 RepID=A7S5X9_NEMVE|nr:predicted protein [Nematostella vectensis]|eukprot:XP_001632946.1 predicted protein [Nematostella vectensis]
MTAMGKLGVADGLLLLIISTTVPVAPLQRATIGHKFMAFAGLEKEQSYNVLALVAAAEDECKLPGHLKRQQTRGMLTMHRWFESCTCGVSVDRGMRIYPRFPRNPEEKTTINSSELIDNNQGYGNRIFGYITPNASGIYVFAVSSDDYSELWLSSDSSPKNVQLIAHVGKKANIAENNRWISAPVR